MATIKDIARIAGVSCTTVSNVIHGRSQRVSAETIALINDTIKTLGYVPNMTARSLVSRSSKVIGAINHSVLIKDQNFMEDPFHSAFIGSIESTLREHGYYLMLRTAETPEELRTFLQNWNVDGLFLTGIFNDSFFDTLSELSIPIVLIDSYVRHPNMCNVGLDDFSGSFIATKHLLERGHKHIAFTSPPIREEGVIHQRLLGYKKALEEADIPFRSSYVFEEEMTINECLHLGQKIASHPDITAIFSTADIMAAGIMAGIRQAGKKIPDDISIVGFDDIDISRLTSPPLTTIHQDTKLKGKLAVDFMLDMLERKSVRNREISLPIRLIERESVKTIL